MTVLKTAISWTDSTWNWATGCNAVSEGCSRCYAEAMNLRFAPKPGEVYPDTPIGRARATRAKTWRPFNEVVLRLDRLADARKFTPVVKGDGKVRPRLVFINSVSDWAHDAIPDEVLHKVFDVMEAMPLTIFQCLTKRPIRARKFLVARYGQSGLPGNVWIGCSTEDNRVAARLDIMRSIKERTGGGGTFFASVEPIVGPTDELDYTGLSWVIAGGESGPRARVMQRRWLTATVEAAKRLGIALWLKQHGTVASHPNLDEAPARGGPRTRFDWLIENGWERLPDESGGATLDKETYREFPPSYHDLTHRLNQPVELF